MLTNGYETGEPHWQLRDDGRLLLGIQTPGGHVAYDSVPVLNIKHLGRWTHLATVYDSEAARVTHYIDGENVGTSSIKHGNFNGQIDELTVFGTPLTEKEIKSLSVDGIR